MRQSKREKINTIIDSYTKKGYFSGTVLVAKNEKEILSKGYGLLDYENDLQVQIDSRFCIASITKLFTAVSIMILQERGLLNVKDSINKYYETFPDGNSITIHHLLTHTSGIANFTDFPEVMEIIQSTIPTEKIIDLFRDKELEFEPGENYKYSNSGYVLLAYIIEKVSNQSYAEFLHENIFQKLNMYNSGVGKSTANNEISLVGYTLGQTGRCRSECIDLSIAKGWADVYSTVEDLYKWNTGLFQGKLISPETLDIMLASYIEIGKTNIGYGFKCKNSVVFHEGWLFGFCSYFAYDRKNNTTIIVLSNNDMASIFNVVKCIEGVLYRRKYYSPIDFNRCSIDNEEFSDYIGVYKYGDEEVLSIVEENGCVYVQYKEVSRQLRFPIYPSFISPKLSRFYAEVIDYYIDFKRNSKSRVKNVVIFRQTYKFRLKKVNTKVGGKSNV